MAAPTKQDTNNFANNAVINSILPLVNATSQEGVMVKVSSETLDKMSGSGGFAYLGVVAQTGVAYKGLVINTDAVFTKLTCSNGDTITTVGLGGATVSAGIYLPAPLGYVFTEVTITSGSAIGYY